MANRIDRGPAHYVTHWRYRQMANGMNGICVFFGQEIGGFSPGEQDIEYKAGVILSLVAARRLANDLNDAINRAVIGPHIELPEIIGSADGDLITPDGMTGVVMLPGKQHQQVQGQGRLKDLPTTKDPNQQSVRLPHAKPNNTTEKQTDDDAEGPAGQDG